MAIEQWDFLKESDKSLGLFYPLHYSVAAYASLRDAQRAETAFGEAGVAHENVRAVMGEFVASQLESRDEQSWLEQAETSLVKFVGTEIGYLREDKDHASAGGAFLFVYTPDDKSLGLVKRILAKHPPVYARRYLWIAIELIREAAGRAATLGHRDAPLTPCMVYSRGCGGSTRE